MAEGDLILSNGTAISPEDIRLIAEEAKKIIASESKEITQYEEISSLSSISSFPAIYQQGTALKLVRVAMSLLKGLDAKNIELSSSADYILWRLEGSSEWNNLVGLSALKGDKGNPGEPIVLRKSDLGIDWKYKNDLETAWQNIVNIDDVKLKYSDLSASDKSELTKIPILDEVSASKGIDPYGKFKWVGLDDNGNPQYSLSLTLPKGDKGEPPSITVGSVETKLPDTEVEVSITEDGYTGEGRPKYLLNFKIPAGRPGQDGNGAGNVYVKTDNIKSGHNYVFQAGADNSANGRFIEAEEVEAGVGKTYESSYPNGEIFNDYVNNIALGQYAHAEGRETNATGPRAHAEGYKTNVFAADSHSEGRETWTVGNYSHSEGIYTITYGSSSHSEGSVETDFEVGEGSKKILNDEEKIRDFLNSFTTKVYPDGEEGAYYHRLDYNLIGAYALNGAFGVSTHAEGINNIVCDKAGHVEGYNNLAGDMIPGHGQDSKVYAPHIEGIGNRVYSRLYAVHVGGAYNTVNSGNYTFAHGYKLSISNDYEAAFGKYNLSEVDGKKVVFSVGVGTESIRENAISVFEDGTVSIPSLKVEVNVEELEEKILFLQNNVTALSNKLSSVEQENETLKNDIDGVLLLIAQLHGNIKVFVLGRKLVFTAYIDAKAEEDTLLIIDSETSVSEDTLICPNFAKDKTTAKVENGILIL